MSGINIEAYLARIGFDGQAEPTLDVLRELHRLHACTIPFENLDPLLGRPVRLHPEDLERKLILEKRGGYCIEQNLLFSHALVALGFRVTGLAGRVRWNSDASLDVGNPRWNEPHPGISARGHMALRIDLNDQIYICDVGYGRLTLPTPLALLIDVEQETSHETYRITHRGSQFVLEALMSDTWTGLYQFELQPQLFADYDLANWYNSNHPESHFRTSLMAARVGADARFTLRNNHFSIHRVEGGPSRFSLTTGKELRDALTDAFLIRLPDDAHVERMLEEIAEGDLDTPSAEDLNRFQTGDVAPK